MWKMTMTALLALSAAGSFAPAHGAALMWGRNGIAAVQKPLPPTGEGRRDWLKYNCYGCHGDNAAGSIGPNVQHADGGDVKEAVLQGVPEGGMPSFAKYLKAKDVTNIIAYLKSIGTKNEPTWVDWWNKVP